MATCLYGKGVSRLRFFLNHLVTFFQIQNDTSLAPADQADQWADSVLAMGADGIAQVSFINFLEISYFVYIF